MSGISSVRPAVTIQRSAAIKIQASVRGQQLRNKQLFEAAHIGDIEQTENLIKHGADVSTTDHHGYTALHYATSHGYVEIVKLLVIAGAEVNATDKYGNRALHWAADNGFEDIVKALVIAGADVNVTNKYGETALDLAKKYGHYDKVKNAIKEGKQKLISLYLSHVEKAAISPIHECESLREPLLQKAPEKLNETQIQQAIKYRKEKKLGTINSLIKNTFASINFF